MPAVAANARGALARVARVVPKSGPSGSPTVGTAANDIGFERQPNGSYWVWISEFDESHNKYNEAWLGKLKQAYGIEKVRKEAKKRGYRLSEEKQDDGRVRLVMRR